jgi:hypothetical protein
MTQPKDSRTSYEVLNELFRQRLEKAEGKEKIAEYGGECIRERLMETSFRNKIRPPKRPGLFRRAWGWLLRALRIRKTKGRKVDHDTLAKIVDVRPQSRAMALTFRGQPSRAFERHKEKKDATEN